jgi:hypothetical protein
MADLKDLFIHWKCPACGHRNFTEPWDVCARCDYDPMAAAHVCDDCDAYVPGATCCGDCEDARRKSGEGA